MKLCLLYYLLPIAINSLSSCFLFLLSIFIVQHLYVNALYFLIDRVFRSSEPNRYILGICILLAYSLDVAVTILHKSINWTTMVINSHVADETSALMYGFRCKHLDTQYPILILCLDQKKYIDRQKIKAQGTN